MIDNYINTASLAFIFYNFYKTTSNERGLQLCMCIIFNTIFTTKWFTTSILKMRL